MLWLAERHKAFDAEFAQVAEQLKITPDEVRRRFEDSAQLAAVRSDIRRRKALDFLVSSVEIDGGPFPGTSVGGCVAGKFRGAHIAPFSGAAVTVGKSFSIN